MDKTKMAVRGVAGSAGETWNHFCIPIGASDKVGGAKFAFLVAEDPNENDEEKKKKGVSIVKDCGIHYDGEHEVDPNDEAKVVADLTNKLEAIPSFAIPDSSGTWEANNNKRPYVLLDADLLRWLDPGPDDSANPAKAKYATDFQAIVGTTAVQFWTNPENAGGINVVKLNHWLLERFEPKKDSGGNDAQPFLMACKIEDSDFVVYARSCGVTWKKDKKSGFISLKRL